jgi:hypothetical protein
MRQLGARLAAALQHLQRKMQAGCGRGRRSRSIREHSLVAFPIIRLRRPMYVRRQRRLAKTLEQLTYRLARAKAQYSFAELPLVYDFRFQLAIEDNPVACPGALSRPH